MDTVIPAMETIKNFNPQQPFNLKTVASAEMTATSASIIIEQKHSAPAQDKYRPGQTGHMPPPPDRSTYGPSAAYGPRQNSGRNRLQHSWVPPQLRPDCSFGGVAGLYANQRNPQLSQSEAHQRIEISITKIQISFDASVEAAEKPDERLLSGTAYGVEGVRSQVGGQAALGKIREVQESFNALTKAWVATAPDSEDPEAIRQLDEARVAWVTNLRDTDEAGFRAWLQIHVGSNALNGDFDRTIKPEGFALEDYNTWMCQDIMEYENGTPPMAQDILGRSMPKEGKP